jgi:ATP-dependent DNA helicase RecG
VTRANQFIGDAACRLVLSPPAAHTENVVLQNGNVVIVFTVPKDMDNPYFDRNVVIRLKVGADKRRVNFKEELRRLFQISNQFHTDELPTKSRDRKAGQTAFPGFFASAL